MVPSTRRKTFLILLGVVIFCALGLSFSVYVFWQRHLERATIRALAANRDVPVALNATPHLLHARALFLLRLGELQEAAAFGAALDRGADPRLRADIHFTMGNARMRRAIELIERGKADQAFQEINLAKAAYRAALKLTPDIFDIKINLETASRLVRDLPRDGENDDPDAETKPRKVWTDLPGLPRGYP